MQHIKYKYAIDPLKQGFFWPASTQKRKEWLDVKRNRPMEAESVYQCRPGEREGSVFLESDFAYYHAPDGLIEGIHGKAVADFCDQGAYIVQAWDTGMSAKSDADHSVCVTGLMKQCSEYHCGEEEALLGECEMHFDVYILNVYRAQLDIGDLVKAAREQFQLWSPSWVIIEKKAHGSAMIQGLMNTGMPIEPVDPTDSKRKRAVTAIGGAAGSTQGWFRQHRVYVPYAEEVDWVKPYKAEMKDFTGKEGNTDDQVDSTVHLVNYAIREGGNGIVLPKGWGSPEEVERQMNQPDDIWSQLNNMDAIDDPFALSCARCAHYSSPQDRLAHKPTSTGERRNFCNRYNRPMAAIASCNDFMSRQLELTMPRR